MTRASAFVVGALAVFAGLIPRLHALAQDVAVRTTGDGIYTIEQSQRGKGRYEARCASCHGRDLSGDNEFSPALAGEDFLARWAGRTVGELSATRTVMPQNAPGTIEPEAYSDVVAYILRANGFRAGDEPLSGKLDDLNQIVIRAKN